MRGDGATNTDPTFNTQNLSPSPDAVKEFQVETSSYAADMGGAGGGQINIVTNSSTSQFHGTVYEFLRNDAMDASTFASMGNNHLVQNNFGGSFGGPLYGAPTTQASNSTARARTRQTSGSTPPLLRRRRHSHLAM